MGSVTLADEC